MGHRTIEFFILTYFLLTLKSTVDLLMAIAHYREGLRVFHW